MDYLIKDIGKRISHLRKEKGITQEKLAEELDITIKHMSSVERGVSSLSLEKIIAISKLFDCTLDYLILGNDSCNISNILPPSILSILSSNDDNEKNLFLEYIMFYNRIREK